MQLSPRFLRRLSLVLFTGGFLAFGVYGITGMTTDAAPVTSPSQPTPAATKPTVAGIAAGGAQEQYRSECGSCHIAYPARFLPARSWHAIMAGLDDHFGENAELDPATRRQIEDYLASNGSTKARYLRGVSADETPLRITDLPSFKRRHHEVPKRALQNNPGLTSMSQCDSCHTKAAQGKFGERDIRIPGYGRWDD